MSSFIPSNPLSRKRVFPALVTGGEGGTLACGWGGLGSPHANDRKKSLALCLLCVPGLGWAWGGRRDSGPWSAVTEPLHLRELGEPEAGGQDGGRPQGAVRQGPEGEADEDRHHLTQGRSCNPRAY
jgi:hypothetical protein